MTAFEKIDLGIIRYANCWEDADVLVNAFQKYKPGKVACIASAGDNAIALLSLDCDVTAFDVSLVQVYLTELKKAAFTELSYKELLIFHGIEGEARDRELLFPRLLPHLSAGAKQHWNEHKQSVLDGIIYGGRFEKYFGIFRKFFLPLVHSGTEICRLLERKTAEEQVVFYFKHWNNLRWRWLMRMFFSRWFMGRYGRDPEMMKHVDVPVHQFIQQKASAHLQSVHATENFMLQMIFTGRFQHSLPYYLREENFLSIKRNIRRLTVTHNRAEEVVTAAGGFDAYCLSNIFEYESMEDFRTTVKAWGDVLPAGTKLAYWNLMAPRSFSKTEAIKFRAIDTTEIAEKDKGFFYSRFLLEEKL